MAHLRTQVAWPHSCITSAGSCQVADAPTPVAPRAAGGGDVTLVKVPALVMVGDVGCDAS